MDNKTLSVEWQSVKNDNADQRLLRVFELLLNENYEINTKTVSQKSE